MTEPMTRSQAALLVGVLEAAFPSGDRGQETLRLYETQFARYPFEAARRAVDSLVNERQSAFLPAWAEVRGAIVHFLPPPPRELEPPVVGPPEAAREAMRQLREAVDERAEVLSEFDKVRVAVRRRYVRDAQAGRLAESTGVPAEAEA